jgi:hypothetical protein
MHSPANSGALLASTDLETPVSGSGMVLRVREGNRKMGRVAQESRASGRAGLRIGEEAGAQTEAASSRHRASSWKHLGRPAFLPASVPLDRLRS